MKINKEKTGRICLVAACVLVLMQCCYSTIGWRFFDVMHTRYWILDVTGSLGDLGERLMGTWIIRSSFWGTLFFFEAGPFVGYIAAILTQLIVPVLVALGIFFFFEKKKSIAMYAALGSAAISCLAISASAILVGTEQEIGLRLCEFLAPTYELGIAILALSAGWRLLGGSALVMWYFSSVGMTVTNLMGSNGFYVLRYTQDTVLHLAVFLLFLLVLVSNKEIAEEHEGGVIGVSSESVSMSQEKDLSTAIHSQSDLNAVEAFESKTVCKVRHEGGAFIIDTSSASTKERG